MYPPSRRSDHCVGWHCLNDAQKFGIIFSASVVAIILAIAWMYYMGRAASIHRQQFSRALPGGRRARHNPRLPANVAMDHLPVVQQWPGYRPQVFYHPMVYHLDPQVPRAYPYLITAPYDQAYNPGIPAITYQGPPAQPFGAQQPVIFHPVENAGRGTDASPPSQSGLPPRPECPVTQQPCSPETEDPIGPLNWRQWLNRLFGMPLGRASTIASSETPRRSTSRSTRASSRGGTGARRSEERTHNSNTIMRLESPVKSRPSRESAPQPDRNMLDVDELQSMGTDVATVHSDDYDLPLQPQTRKPQEPSTAQPRQVADLSRPDVQISSPYIKTEPTDNPYAMHLMPSSSSIFLKEDLSGNRPAQTVVSSSEQTPNHGDWKILNPSSVGGQSNMDMLNGTCTMSGGREGAPSFWDRRQYINDADSEDLAPSAPLPLHNDGYRYTEGGSKLVF